MTTCNPTPVKLLLSLAAIIVCSLSLEAQKLPNIQKTSIYAPANVKIDGKPAEWGDQFQASNGATDIFYTLANDKDRLYLTIQAVNISAIHKLLGGGFKLTVKSQDKLTVPVSINCLLMMPAGRVGIMPKLQDPNIKMDSVLKPMNDQIANNIKEIGVSGVKEISDTLISVYNEYGIKQAVLLDVKKTLTCEVAIPLKYISGLINAGNLKYNITLNGMKTGVRKTKSDGSGMTPEKIASALALMREAASSSSVGDAANLYNPTDFSGVYVLAKK